jgi:hypothetical protein
VVTSEEFTSWKASTNTKFFLKYLQDLREELKEELATGELTKDRADSSAMKYAEYIGMCSAILGILNIEYADISEFYKLDSEK